MSSENRIEEPSGNGQHGRQDDPLSMLLTRRLGSDLDRLPDDPESLRSLPVLWSFLTRRDVNGKLAKEPATVTIRLGLGAWLVSITDPSLEVSLTTSAPVLAEALQALEEAARSPLAAWSPWKRSRGKFEAVNSRTASREEVKNTP